MENYTLEQVGYPKGVDFNTNFHSILLPVALVINSATFFIIYTKTPRNYGPLKIYLLIHQTFNILCDVVFSGMIQPISLLPFCTILIQGPMKDIYPSPLFNYAVYGACAMASPGWMVGILFYRFQSLLQSNSKLKIRDSYVHMLNALFCLVLFTCYVYVLCRAEETVEYREEVILPKYPILTSLFYKPNVYVDECRFRFWAVAIDIIISVAFLCLWGLVSLIGCGIVLFGSRSYMSESTKRLQKIFTLRILSQISVPLALLAVPSIYFTFVLLFPVYYEYIWILNLGKYIFISLHSTAFSLITILVTDSYRKCFTQPFGISIFYKYSSMRVSSISR